MDNLISYIEKHVNRGDCVCGQCIDHNDAPKQSAGHTADVCFFKVSAKDAPVADDLSALIRSHRGEFCEVDLLDGKEHSYLELGGWIGDQGAALMLMGLGELLGLWKLLTPRSVLGATVDDDLVMQMAGAGFITIKAAG